MPTGEHNIIKLMPKYYQYYWHINILEREAQIDASGKVSKEQCHCSSAKIGMGVASQGAVLCCKELGQKGLGRECSNTEGGGQSMGRLKNRLSLRIEKNEAALATEQEEEECATDNLGVGFADSFAEGQGRHLLAAQLASLILRPESTLGELG